MLVDRWGPWYKVDVGETYDHRVRMLVPAKALVIGAYGESVASYRYRTLVDHTSNEKHRTVFLEMAKEEQGHHALVKGLLHRLYPGSDFVLSEDDKALVIVGPRMLEIVDEPALRKAIDLIFDSEKLTGRFYAALAESFPDKQVRPQFQEMGEECFDHATRLKATFDE